MGAEQQVVMNDFHAQWRDIRGEATAALDRVGQSGWFILGKEVASFERALAAHWGLSAAVGCANGLDAIEIGLRCLGLQPGDKVLTTPLSAFATSLAIVRAGGTPVFVDTDASGLIDLDLCAKRLAVGDIRHFVPVHLFGHAFDLDMLAQLKERHDLRIVEDCAQAIGARSHGRSVGSVGQMAATSFYPTKNLGCLGDGGALLTQDDTLARQARCLRDYGQSDKYVHDTLGLNSRLDELQAAILESAMLPRLNAWTKRRTEVAQLYRDGIKHPRLTLPPLPVGATSVWHLFPVLVGGDRDAFRKHLAAAGVASAIHYPGLIPAQKALAHLAPAVADWQKLFPRALQFAQQELSLPIHPHLTDAQVRAVIAACNGWPA